jgi:hypothetical protein
LNICMHIKNVDHLSRMKSYGKSTQTYAWDRPLRA